MDIKAYFEQGHAPSRNSPVGGLMVRVLAKNPNMTCEQAREEAHNLLDKAARGRVYRVPTVYSPAEQEANRAKMVETFRRSATTQIAA